MRTENITPISYCGLPKFRISENSYKTLEKSTGLTRNELVTLTFSEQQRLMYERGVLKKQAKHQTVFSNIYKAFGIKRV